MFKKIFLGSIAVTIAITWITCTKAVENKEDIISDKVILSTMEIKEEAPKIYKKTKKDIVFDKDNLRRKSGVTKHEIDKALDLIKQPQMKEITMAIIDAENNYNVNAFFLLGLIAEESGWMKHPAGDGNNLTGYAVYTSTSKGAVFNSKYDNIMATTKLINKSYLDKNGAYYNGKSIEGVNEKYCLLPNGKTDWRWSKNISSIANNIKNIVQGLY